MSSAQGIVNRRQEYTPLTTTIDFGTASSLLPSDWKAKGSITAHYDLAKAVAHGIDWRYDQAWFFTFGTGVESHSGTKFYIGADPNTGEVDRIHVGATINS